MHKRRNCYDNVKRLGKIFAKDTCDKGPLSKIHEELGKIKSIKNGPKTLTDTLKEDTYISNQKTKRCCTLHDIKERQITITTYHYTPIQNTDTAKCWQGHGIITTLIHYCWGRKMVQPLWKEAWGCLTKQNILLPYHPAIAFIYSHPEELKIYVHTKTCTQMCIAGFFSCSCQNLEATALSSSRWIGKSIVVSSHNGILPNTLKKEIKLSYQTMKRHGRTLNAYYWVKEANLKRLQTLWLQLHGFLEKAKQWNKKTTVARSCEVWWKKG